MLGLVGGLAVFVRLLLYSALTAVLPVVLFNVWVDISSYLFNLLKGYLPQQSIILSFSGLAAWLITVLKIPEIIGVLLGALSTRFVLQFLIRR